MASRVFAAAAAAAAAAAGRKTATASGTGQATGTSISVAGADFRKLLLNRCQKEFEKEKNSEADGKKRDADRADALSEEEKRKTRMLGIIKFIGELFKLKMVPSKIIHSECIERLLNRKEKDADEDTIECLVKLIETVGVELDVTMKNKDSVTNPMDEYMRRINELSRTEGLPVRLKFKLQDLMELRTNKWVARRQQAGPKTRDAIQQEVREQQAAQAREAANRPRESNRRNSNDVRNTPVKSNEVRGGVFVRNATSSFGLLQDEEPG